MFFFFFIYYYEKKEIYVTLSYLLFVIIVCIHCGRYFSLVFVFVYTKRKEGEKKSYLYFSCERLDYFVYLNLTCSLTVLFVYLKAKHIVLPLSPSSIVLMDTEVLCCVCGFLIFHLLILKVLR